MDEEYIIKVWKSGDTKFKIANDYMKYVNRQAKEDKEIKKITRMQALEHIEKILYKETMSWRVIK